VKNGQLVGNGFPVVLINRFAWEKGDVVAVASHHEKKKKKKKALKPFGGLCVCSARHSNEFGQPRGVCLHVTIDSGCIEMLFR
jgi:hypothetical protein